MDLINWAASDNTLLSQDVSASAADSLVTLSSVTVNMYFSLVCQVCAVLLLVMHVKLVKCICTVLLLEFTGNSTSLALLNQLSLNVNNCRCIPLSVFLLTEKTTVCLKKNIPDIFSRNSRKHCRIFIIFGTYVTDKVSNQ